MRLKLMFLLASSFLLASCSSNLETGEDVRDSGNLIDIGDLTKGLDLVRDTNTGCVYVYRKISGEVTISPYYGEDGEVAGCGEENLDKKKYE